MPPTTDDLDARLAVVEQRLGITPPPPSTPSGPVTGKHPADVLPEIKTWTITLPTGAQGDPDNDYMPGRSVPGTFFVQDDGGVAFVADVVDGVHTENSKYPRAEARQMADAKWRKAAWKSSGSHSLTATLALDTRGLSTRRRVNGLQIHDGGDDVGQLMLNWATDPIIGKGLGWAHKDGKAWVPIDPTYVDGTRCTVKISVEKDRVKVWYNGQLKVDMPGKGTGWYWKAGAYAQTGGASEHREPAGAVARVVVYELATTGGSS